VTLLKNIKHLNFSLPGGDLSIVPVGFNTKLFDQAFGK